MAAITGSWKAQNAGRQITALQWGTGYNPIHAVRIGDGRNVAPEGTSVLVDPTLTTGDYSADTPQGYGYALEDETSTLFGYGTEVGTADYQPWGDGHDLESGSTAIPSTGTEYPPYGPYPQGVPGGTYIRAENHGAELMYKTKLRPYEDGANGWENKETSEINDAGISDPTQYVMQTSMTQRDKVRAGSQSSGTANEFDAPIRSRIMPMIEKKWSDSHERRYGMTPKQQDMIVRPWFTRQAGTGRMADMRVNEMYVSEPRNRRAPENPDVGNDVNFNSNGYVDDTGYGWM